MNHRYADHVLRTLASHLGVPVRELLPSHDLYRDWGLTPLSLVVVLLDLERAAAVELPYAELASVRTVADLMHSFQNWAQRSDERAEWPRLPARSRACQNKRRIRRELHHLRWLEHARWREHETQGREAVSR